MIDDDGSNHNANFCSYMLSQFESRYKLSLKRDFLGKLSRLVEIIIDYKI